MDPITLIATALIGGAIAAGKEVGGQVLKDAFTGLKSLIVKKFGDKGDVKDAVEKATANPDSKGRQETLKEELQKADVASDAEVKQAAAALQKLLEQYDKQHGTTYSATVIGSGAVAQGTGATAAGAGGVVTGGSVSGSINTGGQAKDQDKKPDT